MRLTGKQTWVFNNSLYVRSSGTAVGPKEAEGPLKDDFDTTFNELHCGEDNWELAERRLLENAIQTCLEKARITKEDVDLFLAGDLLNQNITANYVARHLEIPFLCMFGACSTSMETISVGAALLDSGFANYILAGTSSHNATAERQYRNPTEYGGQKPNTANSTVTGAGAVLLTQEKSEIKVTASTIGKVTDLGISNPNDMGSAMAPAAASTIKQHLLDLDRSPDYYDLIVTGDLSSVGSPILKDLLKEEGIDIFDNHRDCGLMIYRPDQKVLAGGSGCGCSAVVTFGHLFKQLKEGKLKRIFVVATGALLSTVMTQQNETIPTIAHGVVFESSR
ncbi:stage V sporulation protein AD [Bacillus carboniphilus]|uniref:Stage V sporulation protein AD n=1 Tax=Bacillus carboniphilus TaxID=86663 RepID=A0ABY9JYE4_9BACI|nr:stage V sporulation protein AD [Bacillus carboniphilus]WLR43799.1 stage V sporulation protein AD [Bacillus carboniphilus]